MNIPDWAIEEIEKRTNIVDVVSDYVQLKPRGARYWGLSPFKPEKTPSFSVQPELGLYYCFSTKQGGSVFTFIMQMENMSFPEAARLLAERAGVELPEDEQDEAGKYRSALRELYKRVAGSFHFILENKESAASARAYLEGRNIGPELVERFMLGFAPADGEFLFRFLRSKGYSEQFLARTGLFARRNPRWSFFVNRLMFPIADKRGDIIAFGGRRLEDRGPKYINSSDSPIFHKSENLYGLDQAMPAIRKNRAFVLVEGYTDVLACFAAGVDYAVAPLGTSFTAEQARLLSRYVDRAILLFDDDEAGLQATLRSASLIEEVDVRVEVCRAGDGRDPGDLLASGDLPILKDLVHSTSSIVEFLLEYALSVTESDSPEGKQRVLASIFPYIRSIRSEVRRQSTLELVADELGVERRAVIEDYQRYGEDRSETRPEAKTSQSSNITVDLFLMIATVANRDAFAEVRRQIDVDSLEDPRAAEVFIALEESFRRGETSVHLTLDRLENEETRTIVAERLNSEEFSLNQPQAIADSVRRIRLRSLDRRRVDVEARLRRRSVSQSEQQELLEEKMYLDAELARLRERTNVGTAE